MKISVFHIKAIEKFFIQQQKESVKSVVAELAA
jgi:hypothetical protein